MIRPPLLLLLVQRILQRILPRHRRRQPAIHRQHRRVVPLLADFWADVCTRVERRHRAGRLKQWLNYLRVAYPEAQQAFDALRAVNDSDAISAWVRRAQALAAQARQVPVTEDII